MGKAGGGLGALGGASSSGGGGAKRGGNGLSVTAGASAVPTTSLTGSVLDRVTVKEEPLSEEDLRALQKDRQKKDNHNMSEYWVLYSPRNEASMTGANYRPKMQISCLSLRAHFVLVHVRFGTAPSAALQAISSRMHSSSQQCGICFVSLNQTREGL